MKNAIKQEDIVYKQKRFVITKERDCYCVYFTRINGFVEFHRPEIQNIDTLAGLINACELYSKRLENILSKG